MKLSDGIYNATNFAIAAFGAVALGTVAGTGVGLIALGAGGGVLIKSVRHDHKGKFKNHIKAACKKTNADAALCAFVQGHDGAYIESTLDALGAGFPSIQPTIQDLTDWNLEPIKVADELVARLKSQHNLFNTDANACTLAHHILRTAFMAVTEQGAFWQQSELYVAKTLLARTDNIIVGLDKVDHKSDAILANQEKMLEMFSAQAQKSGVTEAALRAFIEKLGAEQDLAAAEMLPWLEGFIADAQKKQTEKVNEDAAFQAALKEAKKRFDIGQGETASDALMDEFALEEQDEGRRQKERTRRRIHLLQEAIDYDELALNPKAAVQKYRLMAKEMGITSEQNIGHFLFEQTDAYEEQSERQGSNSAALVAIALYQNMLTVFTPDKNAEIWAASQNNLGGVYLMLGERGYEAMLANAVTAFKNALIVFTQNEAPMDWAMTQNNLGVANRILGQRGDEALLLNAVTAFKNALLVQTQDTAPTDWAMIQHNLGNVYQRLSERGNNNSLPNAITAYKNALKVYTQDTSPMQWALTQNSLGGAYLRLGELGEIGMLANAITIFKNAFKVYTQDTTPMNWAMTQNNLGNAYLVLGERGDNKMLAKAVTAFKSALEECTQEKAPMQWAENNQNLGLTLWEQDKKSQAEHCFRMALTYYRKVNAPYRLEKLEGHMHTIGLEP